MFIFSRTYKQRKHWSVRLGLICSYVLPLLMFVGPKVSIDSKGLIRGVWSQPGNFTTSIHVQSLKISSQEFLSGKKRNTCHWVCCLRKLLNSQMGNLQTSHPEISMAVIYSRTLTDRCLQLFFSKGKVCFSYSVSVYSLNTVMCICVHMLEFPRETITRRYINVCKDICTLNYLNIYL